ncbi:MAG TPA: DUF707 domain-containing protein [Terriglobales bacterium]|nr:DUF707 domain-containing protein [Terriglobales bacterium]
MFNDSSSNNHQNLVLVRGGDTSLHEIWVRDDPSRNWDIMVSYFGDRPERACSPNLDIKGPKWPTIKLLLVQDPTIIARYEYIFFPDDDLLFGQDSISTMFNLVKKYEFLLCQPSLSIDSFVSHSITLHHPAFICRYTNFVEIMAPCFSRSSLKICLSSFDENVSGWGLDSLWPELLRRRPGRIGILDAIQIKHTRPVGGPNYVHSCMAGTTPSLELARLLHKYDLPYGHVVTGGIGLNGVELSPSLLAVELEKQPILPRSMPSW